MQPLNWYNSELNIEILGMTLSPSLTSDKAAKGVIKDEEENLEKNGILNTELQQNKTSASIDNKQEEEAVSVTAEISETKTKYTDFDRAIATFVYEYETFQLSRCEKSANERVSIIGEDVILVAEKVPEHELGYKFSARACTLRDYKEE
jgi:hypothetical protein